MIILVTAIMVNDYDNNDDKWLMIMITMTINDNNSESINNHILVL